MVTPTSRTLVKAFDLQMNLISSISVIESPFSIPLDPDIPLPVLTSTVYWCEIF